jgi:hypothetical protein
VAWIFLGSGVTLITGGLIAHYNYINNNDILAPLTEITTASCCWRWVYSSEAAFHFLFFHQKTRKKQAASFY